MNRKILASPYIVWALGFIILPLLMIVYYGLTDGSGTFTLENVLAIADSVHYKAFGNSLLLALGSTVICLVIAYPLAYVLSQHEGKISNTIIMLFILPMWINFLLRVLAMQMLLSNTGIVNALLGFFGLPQQHIMYTKGAILIGMVYDYLPFMILPIYNALTRIDKHIIEAAYDLGAGFRQVLVKILMPLSIPGIVSGVTMVFVPSLTTFAVSTMLGGGKVNLIGNIIEQEFTTSSNWNLGSGLSLVMMIFIVLSMALLSRLDKNGEASLI